ncbi:glycosyltransferase [Alkalisalibacterium limincola]|uniref:Glycosyltransferase family 4 protein n=1 Tax=Alkalisalibacterium limincola TaxID=2699169 RepID=A0A5C8KV50_9GAMM|nr:glycosyltransferase [Alkalisalibacterium limincola]TXK65579.1 glycosyltransferase family 4 protein [Alkalisalibacterium limincola]
MAKRYLLVSRSFHPGNSPRANRTTELAKELCRQGHLVTVLTPRHPEQEALARQYGMTMVDLAQESWPEIPTSFRGKQNLVLRAVRRALLLAFDYPSIQLLWRTAKALESLPRHDVLISIAAPHPVHWGVARAHRRGRLPADVWLADCGDPYMGAENDSFPVMPYFRFPEKSFCRRADAIVVPVEGARVAYYPEFRDKIHVIPQGFRIADYAHLKAISPRSDGVVRFAYAGLFIPGRRDPSGFLQHLVERKGAFEFHVFTKSPELVAPFAKRDPRIILRGVLPRPQVMEALASMDFVVNFENVGARQTPSKLIDYWLCGRPILNVHGNKLGVKVIEQFLSGQYDEALQIERPEQYDISNVVREFDRLADDALACGLRR